MEVVLSPGRFGDEGAPFQNEEIREWSHVDRLTGMLERARVETGRWKTLNQGAARSYGKVIDSRERNSADGSIVQRARRQVEVFQSEAPGRSVQVVRASQWSSSRITDSSATSPLAIASLAQKRNSTGNPDKLDTSSSLNKLSPSLLLSRDEAISERLSTLLGSFAHHISSSTVPLRRIDSKYASRTPISRRSTSNEDLVGGHSEIINNIDYLSDDKSSRESENYNYDKIKEKSIISRGIEDRERKFDEGNREEKIHEINVELEDTKEHNERLKIHEINVERKGSRDYQERLGDCEDSKTSENSKNVVPLDEVRTTANKAAIQLLPSSKANTTVVNLINDSNNSNAETIDIREGKRSKILSWVSPSSAVGEEVTRTDAEESATITTTGPPTSTSGTTTLSIPRREPRIDESSTQFSPGRSVKRVGFCKTEIHFAADSGKVNIVETDEKPPPTNKFRRRKRNSANGLSSNKNLPIEKLSIVDGKDTDFEQRTGDNNKTKIDPNLHRGHTTSVNLGSDFSTTNEKTNREHGIPSESTVKPIEKENNSLSNSASTSIESENVNRKDVCNVVCTDAENNKVLLKVVTTHEPTIARVEIDHLRNNVKNNIKNLPVVVKKDKNVKKSSSSASKKLQKEHTYVNVFTGSKRAPIYENYQIIDSNPKIISDNKIEVPSTTDSNLLIEKNSKIIDGKSKISQSIGSSSSKTKEIDNNKLEKNKVKVVAAVSADGKICKDTELNKTSIGNKKTRNKMKDTKLIRSEGSNCNNCSNNSSRGKSIKEVNKNTTRSSISSGERGDEFVGGNNIHAGVKNSIASKSAREATSAKRVNKSDATTKQKPIEVVYQTAVYNMKNEKLKKPQKGKESKGPRYLNELICGAKMKRPSDSKNGKSSSAAQNGASNKSALQPIKHWK